MVLFIRLHGVKSWNTGTFLVKTVGASNQYCYISQWNLDQSWRMASSGTLRRVALVRTDVSEELSLLDLSGQDLSFSGSSVKVKTYLTKDGQSPSMFWYQATIWDPRPVCLSHPRKLSSDSCGFLLVGRPPWREDGVCNFTRATRPCQRCHSRVHVPQNLRPYLTVSFETGFPFCRLLRLGVLRWRHSNPSITQVINVTSARTAQEVVLPLLRVIVGRETTCPYSCSLVVTLLPVCTSV
jgi:hypothetical protein